MSTSVLERPAIAPHDPVPPPDGYRRSTARWIRVLAVAVALLAVGAVLVAVARPSAAENTEATIQSYMFMPGTMSVHVGDTVTWTNGDTAPHTVTTSNAPVAISSPTLAKGDTFSYTFTVAGTYEYYCAIHPDMNGTVVVLPAAAPASAASPAPAAVAHGHEAATPAPAAPSSVAAAPAPNTAAPSSGATPVACQTQNVVSAMLAPLMTHLEKAHLETSPGQQVADLVNVDQYTKTHTVLLESILSPLIDVVMALPAGLLPLMTHLDKAHLETSPGQQVADLLSVDQYVKTHTVLAEAILAPAADTAMGTSGC